MSLHHEKKVLSMALTTDVFYLCVQCGVLQCWQDWKSDVKKKAGKIKRHFTGTGGGPPCRLQLTPLEEQVIQIMGPVAVTGQDTIDPLNVSILRSKYGAITSGLSNFQKNFLLFSGSKGIAAGASRQCY